MHSWAGRRAGRPLGRQAGRRMGSRAGRQPVRQAGTYADGVCARVRVGMSVAGQVSKRWYVGRKAGRQGRYWSTEF